MKIKHGCELGVGLGTARTIGGTLKIARYWINQDGRWNRYGNANRQLQFPAEPRQIRSYDVGLLNDTASSFDHVETRSSMKSK